jgi:SAM-dependent methyltransferase
MNYSAVVPLPAIRFARFLLGLRVKSHADFIPFVKNKVGLEIGGPSGPFRDSGILPLYRYVERMDNAVYSASTPFTWCDSSASEFLYHPRKPSGRNMICEATDLRGLPDASYDFVLSSHSLEHTANPIKALKEWQRVARPGGAIIVILPHYQHFADHRRRPTPVGHMLEDYARGTDESDETHFEEIIELTDLNYMPPLNRLHARITRLWGKTSQHPAVGIFDEWTRRNFTHRASHHHVFDETNSRELLEASGLKVCVVEFIRPLHIVLLAHSTSTLA